MSASKMSLSAARFSSIEFPESQILAGWMRFEVCNELAVIVPFSLGNAKTTQCLFEIQFKITHQIDEILGFAFLSASIFNKITVIAHIDLLFEETRGHVGIEDVFECRTFFID